MNEEIGRKYNRAVKGIQKRLCKDNYWLFWLLVLIGVFTAYSCCYVSYEIMPQQGWWQYFAWRLTENDVLYKNVYLPLPPYYVFFTTIFYRCFSNHFIFYIWLVGYPIKIMCLSLCYLFLTKKVNPFSSALCVLIGACISSTYLMDVWFDYNPVLMGICLLMAYCIMKVYENSKSKSYLYIFLLGVLNSVLLLSKQTLGIAFEVVVLIMIIVINIKEKRKKIAYQIFLYIIGWFIGALPAIIYFTKTSSWKEFWQCMTTATGAKGGMDGLFNHFGVALGDINSWIIAITLWALVVIINLTSKKGKKEGKNLIFICISILVITITNLYFDSITKTIETIISRGSFIFCIAFVIVLCTIYVKNYHNLSIYFRYFLCAIALSTIIILTFQIPSDILPTIYEGFSIYEVRRKTIKIFCYLFLLLWLKDLFEYFFTKDKEKKYSLLMVNTILAIHFLVSIVSAAEIEEIFMVLYIPYPLAILVNVDNYREKRKELCVNIIVLSVVFLSLVCKIFIPYDWQGWRITPSNAKDLVACSVEGLEGYRVPKYIDDFYNEVVNTINEETDENDTVYCFANIPLFNVLTKREIPAYAPISWFDVCPDNIAKQDANNLYDIIPKVIIWENHGEDTWNILESVFRNGERSGQRYFKEFYDNFVVNNYTLRTEIYNNRDGQLQVWVKNEIVYNKLQLSNIFDGGDGTLENPFLINSAKTLIKFGEIVDSGYDFRNQYVKQTADIDLSDIEFYSIGKYDSDNYFYGVYNGDGHCISNMIISEKQNDYNIGLFGMLGGTVINLQLENYNLSGVCCGAIASHSTGDNAMIINCRTKGIINGVRSGGIADNFNGTIINCLAEADEQKINGTEAANAISYNSNCNVKNVFISLSDIEENHFDVKQYNSNITYLNNEEEKNYIVELMNQYVTEWNKNDTLLTLLHWKIFNNTVYMDRVK